jgi:prepilin-type N-terminal cleavage/methylation domain-containing protein
MRRPTEAGFSLVETLVALAIFAAAAGIVLHFTTSSHRLARAQPEAADVNQRLRVAAATIARDILRAGAGDAHGELGPLANYLPPIVPARTGARSADAELSAFADRVSIVYVPRHGWVTRLAADLVDVAADVPVDVATPGCPTTGLCGFSENARAALLDPSGVGQGYELFSVSQALAALSHGPPDPPFTRTYSRTSAIVFPIEQRVYYLDRPGRRLMVYDGFRSDVPLVDNVVDLEFAYFGDPDPSSVAAPAASGSTCVYAAGDPPVPLLAPLGATALVPLPLSVLQDGPYCGLPPNRFDGDLLRIRRVRVRLRVQAGDSHVRGRGADYVNPGFSDSALNAVRDFEVTFDVAPRNMSPSR